MLEKAKIPNPASTHSRVISEFRTDEHLRIDRCLLSTNQRPIIVDEADTLLDITFSPAVVQIIRRLEIDVQPINDLVHNAPPTVQLLQAGTTGFDLA